jgi:hypothetical protein
MLFCFTLVLVVLQLIRMSRSVWKQHPEKNVNCLDEDSSGCGYEGLPQYPQLWRQLLPKDIVGWSEPSSNARPDCLVHGQAETLGCGKMPAIISTTAPGGLFYFPVPYEEPESNGGLHCSDDGCNNSFQVGGGTKPVYLHEVLTSSTNFHYPALKPDETSVCCLALPAYLSEGLDEARSNPLANDDHEPVRVQSQELPALECLSRSDGHIAPDSSPAESPATPSWNPKFYTHR